MTTSYNNIVLVLLKKVRMYIRNCNQSFCFIEKVVEIGRSGKIVQGCHL